MIHTQIILILQKIIYLNLFCYNNVSILLLERKKKFFDAQEKSCVFIVIHNITYIFSIIYKKKKTAA